VLAVLAVGLGVGQAELWEDVQLVTITQPKAGFFSQPKLKGAFTVGSKVFGPAATLASEKDHEQGHYYQSLLLGPAYLGAIGTPSVIHYHLHTRGLIHKGSTNYEDFYTEEWADSLAKSWFRNF
jgi:hypothetical protein